jgi:nucleotide-binding universal stress UspA family protein
MFPGEWIDGFELVEQVHSGGFGAVVRVARPGAPTPRLVMKLPHLVPGGPASVLAAHEAERAILAVLDGPHVPRLVAAGDVTRRPYLALEEVQGASLARWAERAPLDPAELARLGAAVAAALADIHAQGVLHLDLKPENVIVRDGGEAVLVDFGLARHFDLPDLVAEEVIRPMGSSAYVSPEQLLGIRDEPRSDLFALGVVLYQLATGRLPFGEPTTDAGLRRRLYRDPVPPRARVASVPPWLQELVLWCLERDPRDRPESAAWVAGALLDPAIVPLSARARRLRRDGPAKVLLRWVRAGRFEAFTRAGPPPPQAGRRDIVVAVATAHEVAPWHDQLREAVRRLVAGDPTARVTCVSVIAPDTGEPGPSSHLRHVALLRRWAEPLRLPEARLSCHVLEASSVVDALLDYVRANPVHHVVVGAPPPDDPLDHLFGTVSSRLATGAPCDVTVVRYTR